MSRFVPALLHADSTFGDVSNFVNGNVLDEAFWNRLNDAAEGKQVLVADDAKKILTILRGEENEYSEARIVSLIVNRLKGYENILDEGFLRYLSENYTKLTTQYRVVEKYPSVDETGAKGETDFQSLDHPLQKTKINGPLDTLLSKIDSWDFNIFELQTLTPYPLVVITTHALQQYDLIRTLDLNPYKLHSFLLAIHNTYKNMPYHNALHGADVTQTTYYLLQKGNIMHALHLSPIAVASILLSAAVHDVGHPGVNAKFLVTTSDPLAIQYNDKSPLENMHLATTFALLRQDESNFAENLSITNYREMRRLIIDMVLLTDNDMHFVLMDRLDRLIATHTSALTPTHGHTDEKQLLLLQVTLHTADVSNTAKPWTLYSQWLGMIMEEFYRQGDRERDMGLPITYAFDRENPVPQSKFQLGFIKAIVGPLYKTFSKIEGFDLSECMTHLAYNAKYWKKVVHDEENHATPPTERSRARSLSPIIFDSRSAGYTSPMILEDD